jgi:hypothetical protein
MAHMRIAVYTITRGTAREVAERAEAGLLPIFRRQPGFVAYEGVRVGEDTIISLSSWQGAEQAEAATRQAADWVRQNIADRIRLADNYVGDVLFTSRNQ